jgi:hypothetical protein
MIILFALFGFVLIGALALALDVGYLLNERREAQAMADASALAGARTLLGGDSPTAVVSSAFQYASMNGMPAVEPDSNTSMSVTVEGDQWDGEVTVDLTMDVQRFFLGALYTGPWEVGAHAVAEVTDKADARYILIALDPPGIYVNGSMTLTAKNGSIISNDVITSSGESNVVTSDGFIDAVGTIQEASGWQAPWGIRENRAPAIDPFAAYTPPAKPAGAPITGSFQCKLHGWEDPTIYGEDCLYTPGYYRNANIRIWEPTLWEPGLYYFENTSIEMVGNSAARMDGVGVNFYFTGNPNQSVFSPGIGSAYLTAPGWSADPDELIVHGDYRDLVIWYDMCPGPELNSSGNQEFFLGGVTYAPCSDVYLHGNPYGDTISGMLIAGTVTVKGTSDTGVAYLPYGITSSYEVYLIE